MKNIEEFSGKKTQENGPAGTKKDKTERVTGQGRKTREEVVKWNQKTALRFQTGGDVRHPQPPSGPEGVDTITHHTFTKQKQPQATSELVYREPDQPLDLKEWTQSLVIPLHSKNNLKQRQN